MFAAWNPKNLVEMLRVKLKNLVVPQFNLPAADTNSTHNPRAGLQTQLLQCWQLQHTSKPNLLY